MPPLPAPTEGRLDCRPATRRTQAAESAPARPTEHAATQAEALQVLLSMSVGPSTTDGNHPEGTGHARAGARPARDSRRGTRCGQTPAARTGTHAGNGERAGPARAAAMRPPRPPYLDRRGARFVVFSAIGGSVFLMGLGLQAVLTGWWHVAPVVSYLVQAVASVEASFLLNRWLTWRDRGTPFWTAFARFNAQKTVTIVLNLALYAGLLRLGVNYLVANVVLTAVFTVVNYVAGDRLVFLPGKRAPAEPAAPAVPAQVRERPGRRVSAVIPCRDNERTIGAAVQSLLNQDYPGLQEIMLIGSPGDSTWNGLADFAHPRLSMWELETPPGVRDANFKRDAAVRMTSGDLIALVDSDIVLPCDWMSQAVAALENSGASCVAGGMKSFHDSFWGRYTDSTWIGAKTPRIAESYTVTSANFGAGGRKPPILANTLFTRELYERCPIDPLWSHGSYEDYEWFWRVTKAGYRSASAGSFSAGTTTAAACARWPGSTGGQHGDARTSSGRIRTARSPNAGGGRLSYSRLRVSRGSSVRLKPSPTATAAPWPGSCSAARRTRHPPGRPLAEPGERGLSGGRAHARTGLHRGTGGQPDPATRRAAAAPSRAPVAQPGKPAGGRDGASCRSPPSARYRLGFPSPWSGAIRPTSTRRTTSGWDASSSRTGCMGHHGHRRMPTTFSPGRLSSIPRSAPWLTAPTAWLGQGSSRWRSCSRPRSCSTSRRRG